MFKKNKNKPRRRLSERKDNNTLTNNGSNFRRSKTLTSGRTRLASSTSPRKQTKISSRIKTHDLTTKRRRAFLLFLGVIAVIIVVWALLFNFASQPIVIISNDNTIKMVESKKYENVIQEYLNYHPVSRLSFVLSSTDLTDYVSDKLPEVKKITKAGSNGIGEAKFNLVLRESLAGWRMDDKQYYVDEDGVQFETNYFAEPEVQIVDESGVSFSDSSSGAIASRRFLSFVGRVVSLSKQAGYTVVKAILPNHTTRQLNINLQGRGCVIKLSIDRPAGEQVEDMATALRYFDQHNLTPGYIDVRVSERAFFL